MAGVARRRTYPSAAPGDTDLSPYDELVLRDAPILFLPCNGNADDATGNHVGTVFGNPSPTTLPNGDTAMVFNGEGDFFEFPDAEDLSISTTGALTVEAWIRPDVLQFPHEDPAGYVYIYGKGVPSNDEYAQRMYSALTPGASPPRPNRISFYVWNLDGGKGSGSYFQDVIVAGQWMHLAATVDTTPTSTYPLGSVRIFRNGVLRQTTSLTQFDTVPAPGAAPFRVATRDTENYFLGAISKVGLYDYVLPNSRILARVEAILG